MLGGKQKELRQDTHAVGGGGRQGGHDECQINLIIFLSIPADVVVGLLVFLALSAVFKFFFVFSVVRLVF